MCVCVCAFACVFYNRMLKFSILIQKNKVINDDNILNLGNILLVEGN